MSATHTYYTENLSGSRRYFSTSESNCINRENSHEVHLSPASNHPVRVSSHSPRRLRSSVRVSSPITVRAPRMPVCHNTQATYYTVPTRISYERRPVRSYYAQRVRVSPYHSSYIPSRYIVDSRTYEGLRSTGSRVNCTSTSITHKLASIDEKNEEVFDVLEKCDKTEESDNNMAKERYDYLEPPMKACNYDEGEVSTDNEDENIDRECNVVQGEEIINADAEVLKVMQNAVSMKLKNWFRTKTAQDKIFSEEDSEKTCDAEEKKKIVQNLKGEDREDNESVVSFCYSINDQTPVRVFRKNSRNACVIESSESMYQF